MKKPCEHCHKEFEVKPCNYSKRRFCSHQCDGASKKGIKRPEHSKKMSMEGNPRWKEHSDGQAADALHVYIARRLPKPELCQVCNKKPPMDLANKDHKYSQNLDDWFWACRRCHIIHDGRMKNLKQFQGTI